MRPWIRVGIAGFLGGVAMFMWASIAHMATPLGSMGISQIPSEDSVVAPIHDALGDHAGLYAFPWLSSQSSAAMKAYRAKLADHPSGLLVYKPPGTPAMQTSQLVTEFISEAIQSIIAAALLAWAALAGFWKRVGFVALLGAAAAIVTNISYWNWYGFPASYTAAYASIEWIGYVAAGLVIAAVLPRNIPNGLWRVSETEVAIAAVNSD